MIPKREAQDQKQRRSRRHGWTADHVKIHCPLEAHSVGLVGRQPHEADVDSIIVSRGTQRAPGDNGGIGEGSILPDLRGTKTPVSQWSSTCADEMRYARFASLARTPLPAGWSSESSGA